MKYLINVNSNNGLFSDIVHDLLPCAIYLNDNDLNDFSINWTNPLYQSNSHNLYDYFFKKNKKFNHYENIISINNCPYKGYFNPEITREKIIRGHEIVQFLNLKDCIVDGKVNNFLKSNKKVLGVQQRLTDHIGEKPILDDKVLIDKVEKFFIKNNFDLIFLCTDSNITLNNFKNYFEHHLIYNENIVRSSNNEPVHSSLKKYEFDRISLAEDALLDSISLSYTDYKFICRSNLSFFSLIYNYSEENYEYII